MNKLALYCSAYMNFPYTLPPLDYAYNALEPYIDEQTMHLHHDKHHQAYIDNANKVVGDYPELQKKTLVELLAHLNALPADIRTLLQNNGGGHLNHALFWNYMTPQGAGDPQGKLSQAMTKNFGGFTQKKSLIAPRKIARAVDGHGFP
jgi:superoxide dismutase, Fe-Mn family